MCANIGVDPLASSKGFWANLLGVGDLYYELAVQIIEICLATQNVNGGLISLTELLNRIRRGKFYETFFSFPLYFNKWRFISYYLS